MSRRLARRERRAAKPWGRSARWLGFGPGPGASGPVLRQRRLLTGGLVAALVAGIGITALLAGDGLSGRDRSQIEAAAPGGSKSPDRPVPVSPAVRRAAATLSLPRQVAQLFAVDLTGQYSGDPSFAVLAQRRWGAVVLGSPNFASEGQLSALTGEINAIARQSGGPQPLIAINQSGGRASALSDLPPAGQPAVGRTGRPLVAASQARAAAAALNALGINMNLAPVADVGAAAGPVQNEVFGDDPILVSRMTRAAVDAYRNSGVIPAVSHFPGIGAASADPNQATATVGLSLAELRARDLRPFGAVAKRVPVVIVGNAVYAAFDGVTPAVLLPAVTGLLRRELGFRGVAMTDDLNSTVPIAGGDIGPVAVRALAAGADLLYVSGAGREQEVAYRAVLRAVRTGRISRERLRVSVWRVLTLKRNFGLLPASSR